MRKYLIISYLVIFFLLLTTYNPNSLNLNIKLFPIEKIEVLNLKILDSIELENYFLENLKANNLLFLNKKKIINLTKKYQLIETIEIKKVYPNKIKLKIFEKIPIGILHKGKDNFYIISDGKVIKFFKNKKLEKLPSIYGKKENFVDIYKALIMEKFPLKEIKAFYFFEIGRWDIALKNKKIIKLPAQNFQKSIQNFVKYMDKIDFDNYTIFDYRINNQLILN